MGMRRICERRHERTVSSSSPGGGGASTTFCFCGEDEDACSAGAAAGSFFTFAAFFVGGDEPAAAFFGGDFVDAAAAVAFDDFFGGDADALAGGIAGGEAFRLPPPRPATLSWQIKRYAKYAKTARLLHLKLGTRETATQMPSHRGVQRGLMVVLSPPIPYYWASRVEVYACSWPGCACLLNAHLGARAWQVMPRAATHGHSPN